MHQCLSLAKFLQVPINLFCLCILKQEKINRTNTVTKIYQSSSFLSWLLSSLSMTPEHTEYFIVFSSRLLFIPKVKNIIHEVHTDLQRREMCGIHSCVLLKFTVVRAKLTADKFFPRNRTKYM